MCYRKNQTVAKFLKWIDDEWPPHAQIVMCALWDMVDKFMQQADVHQVDAMAERKMRNEAVQDKKNVMKAEKEALLRECWRSIFPNVYN